MVPLFLLAALENPMTVVTMDVGPLSVPIG
jgi:hypothetical protein